MPATRRTHFQGAQIAKNLATFDAHDYDVFSHRRWSELGKSHAQDLLVQWPDGHVEQGLEAHARSFDAMFAFAPDARITQHPIKIAAGEWTAVMGVMEGTFTEPMPRPDGATIPPTGRSFQIPMVTLGRWNKDGLLIEEYLFWDNLALLNQIGVGGGP